MNIANDCLYSISKEYKDSPKLKKKIFSEYNIKKNLKIMNDPAFQQNKTLKEYIAGKLKGNNLYEKNIVFKDTKSGKLHDVFIYNFPKMIEQKNNFIGAKTLANMMNKSKDKIANSRKKGQTRTKNSNSKSKKRIIKSKSNNKINLTHYIFNNQNKSKTTKNKIYSNQMTKTKSFNSTHKYFRSTATSTLNINENNNQCFSKNNNSLIPSIQFISNHSTIEVNSIKKPFMQTNPKKNKFISQFLNNKYEKQNPQNSNDKLNNIINIKNNITSKKNDNIHNLNHVHNINSIKSNKNLVDPNNFNKNQDCGNIMNNSVNKRTFNISKNNSVIIINTNISNKTDNSINYFNKKEVNKENEFCKESNDVNYSIINDEKYNNIEYIKKIQMLEKENKLLKGEISESKNRLMKLENKIEELLEEKHFGENEECPKPTPYVKKYSLNSCIDFLPSNSVNNYKKEEIVKDKDKNIKSNTPIKSQETIINNKFKNDNQPISNRIKIKNFFTNNSVNNFKNDKYPNLKSSLDLNTKYISFQSIANKSISCSGKRNNTDIQLKEILNNHSNNNKNEGKKIRKKIKDLSPMDNSNIITKNTFQYQIVTDGNIYK